MGGTETNEKIWRRAGHIAFQHRDEMFIWGGFTEHLHKEVKLPNTIPTNGNSLFSSEEILSYDSLRKVWRIWLTNGDVPPRTLGACGTYQYVKNPIYIP